LHRWRAEDREPFARLNADSLAEEHFVAPLSRVESDQRASLIEEEIERLGYGFWAVECAVSGAFLGFTGVRTPSHALPISPCVEIGWRLAREHWGMGYATEAAQRALSFAFESLELEEIVAFTAVSNWRSRRVMERLKMSFRGEFEHPAVPSDSLVRRHVWYSLSRARNG
jgi:RimJ/RimL family protein N-acetyltransferase